VHRVITPNKLSRNRINANRGFCACLIFGIIWTATRSSFWYPAQHRLTVRCRSQHTAHGYRSLSRMIMRLLDIKGELGLSRHQTMMLPLMADVLHRKE
jgi:hypothetical protein